MAPRNRTTVEELKVNMVTSTKKERIASDLPQAEHLKAEL
jgi:hypothetical protein